jgi:hypothetical protein
VTINTDQVIRLNVVCFQHSIGGVPPPCRGEAMFHDAAGRELIHRTYDLQPGEAAFIQFAVGTPSVSMLVDIVPCLLPAAGGPVAPDVEVFDRATGNVALLLRRRANQRARSALKFSAGRRAGQRAVLAARRSHNSSAKQTDPKGRIQKNGLQPFLPLDT